VDQHRRRQHLAAPHHPAQLRKIVLPQVDVQQVALTGERCDAAPGTVSDGNRVATADEWLLLKKWK
jgi:hypothetical protein